MRILIHILHGAGASIRRRRWLSRRLKPDGYSATARILQILLLAYFCCTTIYAEEKSDKFAEAYKAADEAIERNRLTNSFFAIGPTVGLPSGLNLHAQLHLWRFIFRGSGMFYGSDFMGYQGDFGFSLFNGVRVRHSLSFVGGYMKRLPLFALDPAFPDNKTGVSQATAYFGGAYELFMDGFFLQAGIGKAMSDELKNPMLIFQAGYLFYFPQ